MNTRGDATDSVQLVIRPQHCRFGGLNIRHFQVSGVRHFTDLLFKGVRGDYLVLGAHHN